MLLTSGHLLLEHLDHVVEVAGSSNLLQHLVQLRVWHELADVVEGGAEVVLGDGAILVDVHQLEALLVHLNLLLAEAFILSPFEKKNLVLNLLLQSYYNEN